MSTALQRLLASPRVSLLAVALALVLNLPSVPSGWHMDDVLHRAQFLEVGPMMDSSDMTNRMFDFLSGDPEQIQAYKDIGVLPWWAHDELTIRFWRPLSSLTHVIDYALWPESGALMHLHNLAWLALLIFVVARLYRRLLPAAFLAGLAALLYALDDAHGLPVGFLANRNAIVATTFGALSLLWLDRWRGSGWSPGAFLSPLAFAAALLAGESGLGAAPYILGFAIFLEPERGAARWTAILPHTIIGIGWLALYKLQGYGTSGTGFYLDPLGEPLGWLSQFVIRAPLLLLGQWFLPPSSFAFLWTPRVAAGLAVFGVVVLATVLALSRPILAREPVARFLAFGMLLSVVPITAGFPHDRLLFFVGIGAMGLLSMLLAHLFEGPAISRRVAWTLAVVHVAIAAPMQLLMSTAMAAQEPLYAGPARSLPDDPKLESQRLVVVNPPAAFYGQYTILIRRFDGNTAPASLLLMAPGTSVLRLERISERTLTIEAEDGFLQGAFDHVFRAESLPLPVGYRVELSDVAVEVLSVGDNGRPRNVEFTFTPSVDAHRFRWVRYESGRYVPFVPPAVGEGATLDAVPFNLLAPEG